MLNRNDNFCFQFNCLLKLGFHNQWKTLYTSQWEIALPAEYKQRVYIHNLNKGIIFNVEI